MVSKKTYIITIVSICSIFIAILVVFGFYHNSKLQEVVKQKESITILQKNNESTGLENIIVE